MAQTPLILNPEQTAAVNAGPGVWAVLAGPGSGKTQVLVSRYQRLVDSGVDPTNILSLTFTAEAATNMRKRAEVSKVSDGSRPSGFRTFHSLALSFAQLEGDNFPYKLRTFPLALEDGLYALEAIKRFRVPYKDFRNWMSDQKHLRIQPAEAIRKAENQQELNFAHAYQHYENLCRHNGVMDFDSLILEMVVVLEGSIPVRNRWQYEYVQTDESQDSDPLQWRILQLLTEAHGNLFSVGDVSQCHPAGTLIQVVKRRPSGARAAQIEETPIERVVDGDLVVSWDHGHTHRLRTGGRAVAVGKRGYRGELLTISTADKSVRVTPDHWMWAKFSSKAFSEKKYFVYLMWKEGLGFRVGISHFRQTGKNRVNAITHRGVQERANKFWILRVVDSRSEAETYEEIISLKYQIPECIFHSYNGVKRTDEQIREVFQTVTHEGGHNCLVSHGLLFYRPFAEWPSDKHQKFHGYFKTAAANLLAGVLEVPGLKRNNPQSIVSITRESFNGDVYSLGVPKDRTYVANGIPVGNCVYAWRAARPELFLNLTAMFTMAKKLFLAKNHRSTPEIVEVCKAVAPHKELGEKFYTENESGVLPVIHKLPTEVDEADAVMDVIAELYEDAKPTETLAAVLARTNRQLRAYQDLLYQSGIRYHLLGKSGFWSQKEIKKVMEELKSGSYNYDLSAEEAVKAAISATNILNYCKNYAEIDNSPLENLTELTKIASRFKTTDELIEHANKVQAASKFKKGVALGTIHQAKGREFDTVFVIGCQEGVLPHKNGDLDEEARIFFVACSRAAKQLYLTHSGPPSRFLAPLREITQEAFSYEPLAVSGRLPL